MKYRNKEAGSADIILIIIIVLAVIVGIGYWLFSRATKTTTDTTSNTGLYCSDLTLTKGSPDGTAGTIYWHAVITNNAPYDCQLTGYPAAFMTDSTTLSVGATSSSQYPPETITLAANGGKAHTVIGLPEPGNFSPGVTCTDAASSTLQLYLPGSTTAIETNFGESACPSYTVTAMQPGE